MSKHAGCARLWEAEALEDGRLGGADRASFERHLDGCAACQGERDFLAALRRATGPLAEGPHASGARRGPGLPAWDPLERQRLRASLLREANRRVLSPAPGRARSLRVALAVSLAVAATGVGVVAMALARHGGDSMSESPVSALELAPTYEVETEQGAIWRSRTDGAHSTVVLASGTVSFHVPRLAAWQRFIVELPDGEVEVRGTRFTVTVVAGRTEAVSVAEGKVAVRRAGYDETLLGEGDRWSRVPVATALDTKVSEAAAASVASLAEGPPDRPAPRPKGAPTTPRPALQSGGPRAGELFAAAMKRFEAGELSSADAELSRFGREFPSDPRCEDAAFLRSVARSRMGDTAGARTLARAYLAAYPNALRRADAERLAALPAVDAGDHVP